MDQQSTVRSERSMQVFQPMNPIATTSATQRVGSTGARLHVA
jgi:hypothetical protein